MLNRSNNPVPEPVADILVGYVLRWTVPALLTAPWAVHVASARRARVLRTGL